MSGSTMTNEKIYECFNPLWDDVKERELQEKKPLLAHYTSIANLEKILANEEIWFSNPLLMNDLEELQYGIRLGAALFFRNTEIREVCDRQDRYNILINSFENYYNDLDREHAFDIYALCFSEHDPSDNDGLLSMWRGYGGNGKGAAIVLDSSAIPVVETSPFVIGKVYYGSADERKEWIESKLTQFAEILAASQIRDDKLFLAAYAIFERIKLFALFTKHPGFAEEREWRIVYLKERDDVGRLHSMLGYSIGKDGIEPKLKFKIGPIDGVTGQDLTPDILIDRIIVGPSGSSALEVHATRRMLESLGKSEMVDRLVKSSTPFRAT